MSMVLYDESWYRNYAESPVLDSIKKYLEYDAALELLQQLPHCGPSLDVGTATGRYLLACHRWGYIAYGIDISPAAIDISRHHLKAASVDSERAIQMDVCNMQFPDRTFNLVTCMMGTFTHFSNPEAALSELFRVMTPGGHLLLSNWQPKADPVDFLHVNSGAHNDFLACHSPHMDQLVATVLRMNFVSEKHADAVFLSGKEILRFVDSHLGEPGGYLDRMAFMERHIRLLFPHLRGQILLLLVQKPL